jgi:hypothetical protein
MPTHHTLTPSLTDRFVVPCKLDFELGWFFEKHEDAMGSPADPTNLDRVWEHIAYKTIRRWLCALDDYEAGVLRCAYASGPRPPHLEKRLGNLTTLVVRLASAEEGWPEDASERDKLEARVAARLEEEHARDEWRAVLRHARTASELLRAAVKAYSRERGRGPCMVQRVT